MDRNKNEDRKTAKKCNREIKKVKKAWLDKTNVIY